MPSDQNSPNIWVLQTGRTGDNAQARSLANELGWPAEHRNVRFNVLFTVPNILLGRSLISVNQSKSDSLDGPWPDLVISVGRRTVPIARWIKAQSGGKTKLVQLGRPRADNNYFDLVVSSPQYRVADGPNVLQTSLPIPDVTADLPKDDGAYWLEEFNKFPRPWTGVLMGGEKWPFTITPEVANSLIGQTSNIDGSLLLTTSPRTPAAATTALQKRLGKNALVHNWRPNTRNPYQAILAHADRFIVTGDSASMLSEACATGRSVQIFELPRLPSAQVVLAVGNFLSSIGLIGPPRDIRILHKGLIKSGHAVYLGSVNDVTAKSPPDNLDKAAERVRRLFEV